MLYSGGHDGFVCTSRYAFGELQVVRRVGVKGISTIKSIYWQSDGGLRVFGFHATQAILVDVSQSFRLLALECGGYRRPHALFLSDTDVSHVFAFTTPGSTALQVHSSTIIVHPSSGHQPTTTTALNHPFLSWHGHHHSKMATSVAWVHPLSSSTPLLVTGGEDCALKLHAPHSTTGKPVQCVDTVTMHGTNVRSVAVVGRDWVVSGGGKQSVHLWQVVDNHLDHVAEHTPSDASQDQRILALAATSVQAHGTDTVDNVIAVFATNSEGQSTFFTASTDRRRAGRLDRRLMWTGRSDKPILSCVLTASHFFVTGATDGYVVIWDVATLLRGDTSTSPPRQVYQYRAHDMGVNCLCIRVTGPSTFDVFSGGDDQNIAHAAVDATDRLHVQVRHLQGKQNASASALKAIQVLDDVVVAAGYDQRVTAWGVERDELTWRGAAFSECADIAGVSLRRPTLDDDGVIEAVVVGKGMQIVTFQK
ncbi:hypothetical protein DYB30_008798 [Aphanomyces astaci]|uniref:Anaphase-promoting complex subunit 4 WD40 domain-containing protein n=1 Tax=Aphanomyces astaci TaxID=112090 RepID=A0A397CAU6_APHAT|nr:hypothetical protein DYB30_008798 [Aphanomyces astaci]